MTGLTYLLAVFFLPLFPFSMVFNIIFARLRSVVLRSAVLLAWPQVGVILVYLTGVHVPRWLILWAIATSLFYGFRVLALRDVGLWISFLATSAWALLWIPSQYEVNLSQVQLYALGFSAPFVLLALLAQSLARRFGAAYTGLYGGLAHNLPRFAGVLVFVVLAAVATPLFPAFFTMLATIAGTMPTAPLVAVAVAGVWLLWSWAGVQLLQGLIVGPARTTDVADLSLTATWSYVAVLAALVVSGFYLAGGLS